ncbi:MAG: GNAT family N-acetyltransferase [Candidatus Micrarchaeota archaeon]
MHVIESDAAGAEWDGLVSSVPSGTFFQSASFAGLSGDFFSGKPFCLKAVEEGKVVGTLLLFKKFPNALAKTAGLARLFAYNGPVILDSSKAGEIAGALLQKAFDISRREKACELFLAPPYCDAAALGSITVAFAGMGLKREPSGTFLVDLSQSEEKLWSNLDKAAKKAVKQCTEEFNLSVEKVDSEEELGEYLNLLKKFRTASGFAMPMVYPSQNAWKKERGKTMEVFVAKDGGKIVSGIGVVFFNGVAMEIAVARDVAHKAYAQDLLKWHVLLWAKRQDFRLYDLAGVNPNPSTDKERGGFQFKAKWGGTLVKYDNYRKVFSKNRVKLLEFGKKIYGRVRRLA